MAVISACAVLILDWIVVICPACVVATCWMLEILVPCDEIVLSIEAISLP